jgi:hypothetical protein
MARTNVPVGRYGRGASGLDKSTVTAVAGNTVDGMVVVNTGRTMVDIDNTNGASTSHIATFLPIGNIEGVSVTIPETIAAGKTIGYGPFPVDKYGSQLKINANHAELTFIAWELPAS